MFWDQDDEEEYQIKSVAESEVEIDSPKISV